MKLALSALSLSLLLTGSLAASAQTTPQPPPPSGQSQPYGKSRGYGHPHHRHGNPEFETRMLTKKLGLSSQQAEAIKPILVARDEKMKALHADSSATPQQMHQQRKAIDAETQTQMATVLTPTQQQELATLKSEHRHHGDWHQQQGQQQPAPTPGL